MLHRNIPISTRRRTERRTANRGVRPPSYARACCPRQTPFSTRWVVSGTAGQEQALWHDACTAVVALGRVRLGKRRALRMSVPKAVMAAALIGLLSIGG